MVDGGVRRSHGLAARSAARFTRHVVLVAAAQHPWRVQHVRRAAPGAPGLVQTQVRAAHTLLWREVQCGQVTCDVVTTFVKRDVVFDGTARGDIRSRHERCVLHLVVIEITEERVLARILRVLTPTPSLSVEEKSTNTHVKKFPWFKTELFELTPSLCVLLSNTSSVLQHLVKSFCHLNSVGKLLETSRRHTQRGKKTLALYEKGNTFCGSGIENYQV